MCTENHLSRCLNVLVGVRRIGFAALSTHMYEPLLVSPGTTEHKLTHPKTGTGVTGTHAHTSTVHTGGVGAEAQMAKHQVGRETCA